ncbi:MAG: hypothetical protein PVF27_00545 [Gemmatimonadales bacterium]|jgi:hypothetical protein
MRITALKGPRLLLAIQTAPVAVEPDSTGDLRLTFGYGTGQFESRDLNCAGDVVGTWPIPYSVAGAAVDYSPARANLRLSAAAGMTFFEGGTEPWMVGQLAWEGSTVGLGGGFARNPYLYGGDLDLGTAVPSAYLRIGRLDGIHFRSDVFHPNATLGITGDVYRLGLAANQGRTRGVRWYAGVHVGPYGDEAYLGGFFAEFDVPLSARLDAAFAASYRPSDSFTDYGLSLGIGYYPGR